MNPSYKNQNPSYGYMHTHAHICAEACTHTQAHIGNGMGKFKKNKFCVQRTFWKIPES